MLIVRTVVAMLFLLPCTISLAGTLTPAIPDQLQPWKEWVLHGYDEEIFCTPRTDESSLLQCDWPGETVLQLNDSGGSFSQTWLVQHDRWIQVPGDLKHWPERVVINNKPALVISRQGMPHVWLEQGSYEISGEFSWKSIPEYVAVPSHSAIVNLTINNKRMPFPDLDEEGRIWLRSKKSKETKTEDRLTVQVFRLIDDRIPLKTEINIQLDVSGTPREVIFGPVLAAELFIPVSLTGALPARLEGDGRLRVQIRPGQWNLTLVARHIGPAANLLLDSPDDGFWPKEEIWAFNSHPELRVVEIEGVPAIDPLQTSLPPQWQNHPAYRVLDGESMAFKEIKRGDPQPAPDQLSLSRNIWLRFDGSGYTLQDAITGTKTTNWRLEMNSPVRLGRVEVDGQVQFITKDEKTGKSGVELRRGMLNLAADSEYEGNISNLPATGWDQDFQQVRANLFLPPGWKLIHAAGMDNINATWVKRWTLLDFFIVLILTLAIARLYSKSMAGLAFTALALMYHEPDAPRWIWLAILICVALLRHLPEGRFKKSVRLLQIVNILVLFVIAVPFSIQQLRVGIYPQLEKPWQAMTSLPETPQAPPQEAIYEEQLATAPMPDQVESLGGMTDRIVSEKMVMRAPVEQSLGGHEYAAKQEVAQYDPAMINQTGPGIPNWQWNIVPFSWSGPVRSGQQASFLFTGPKTNLILAFVRVILLALLSLGILGIQLRKGGGNAFTALKPLFVLTLVFLLTAITTPPQIHAGDIPSPEMFEELRNRLLEKEDCFPECTDISRMQVNITPDELHIRLRIEALTKAAVPLPGDARHWLPQQVLLNNEKVPGLFRTNNQLWLLVPPGEQSVELKGAIPRQNSLQLPLPIKPHKVECTAEGWTVEGIRDNNRPDNQLQFKRIVTKEATGDNAFETGVLPPFLLIERTFSLGLTWKITTQVKRLSPGGAAVVFSYPLLAGESVITEGIRVQDNQARINLDSDQNELHWESVIEKTGAIELRHAETDLWTEVWRVDASPIFHMETKGIPVIHHQQGNRWLPTWHPWPGEAVELAITRPAGVKGQTITIDRVHIEHNPGKRAADTTLTMTVRSSQGDQHAVTLPGQARLQEVRIDGRTLPIRQEDNRVTLPIRPGEQEIALKWTEDSGISTYYQSPGIDLGLNSVNAHIEVRLPGDRWPLFMGGPLMGPAVLFWSVVLIILLVSFGLRKTGLTPLRFHQWFLLGIGMSQGSLGAAMAVALWLIVLDLRHRVKPDMDKTKFNLMQIGIAALTAVALAALVVAVSQGLLGRPDMNIIGNGSDSGLLKWYQDQSANILPRAWVISIPMFVYRLAMLAWALWISFCLINLLKWGWKNYTEPVIWHRIEKKKTMKEQNL